MNLINFTGSKESVEAYVQVELARDTILRHLEGQPSNRSSFQTILETHELEKDQKDYPGLPIVILAISSLMKSGKISGFHVTGSSPMDYSWQLINLFEDEESLYQPENSGDSWDPQDWERE